eukprot:scaffold1616_cov310-Pinguiococcus_pyrenoidosus.AAC.42
MRQREILQQFEADRAEVVVERHLLQTPLIPVVRLHLALSSLGHAGVCGGGSSASPLASPDRPPAADGLAQGRASVVSS